MAQSSINLIPKIEQTKQRKTLVIKFSSIISVVFLLIASGISYYYWSQVRDAEKELEQINSQIELHRADINSFSEVEIVARELDARYKILESIFKSRRRNDILMEELRKRVPNDVTYSGLSLGGGNSTSLILSGKASDLLSVGRFVRTLSDQDFPEAAPGYENLFYNASLKNVTLDTASFEATYSLEVQVNLGLLYEVPPEGVVIYEQ